MGYPTTIDSGSVTPQIINNEVATHTGSSQAAAANNVYLWAFELQSPVTITGVRYWATATAAGNVNMGIYTAAGNIVAGSDTGAITNHSANVLVTSTYATPIMLSAGQYFLAFAATTTDTFQGVSPTSSSNTRSKKATNALAAGALPLTTGTIITNPSIAIGMAALVSGGLA